MIPDTLHNGEGACPGDDLLHAPRLCAVCCCDEAAVHIKASNLPQGVAGDLVDGDVPHVVRGKEGVQLGLESDNAAHRKT